MWRPLDISPAKWHEDFQLLTDAWLVRSRSHLVDHRASELVVPLMALQSLELLIIHRSNMKGLWLWRKRIRYVSVNILLIYFIFAVTLFVGSSVSSQGVLKIWAKSIAKKSMWAQAQVIHRNLLMDISVVRIHIGDQPDQPNSDKVVGLRPTAPRPCLKTRWTYFLFILV